MKLIDEKGKLFGLINIFDLLILLLVVAVGTLGFMKLSRKESPVGVNHEEIMVKFLVDDVRIETVEAVKGSENGKDYESGLPFGTIEAVEYETHYEYVEAADGSVVKSPVEDKYDLYITYKCNAVVSKDQVTVATKHVGIGRHFTLTGKLYGVYGLIIEVDLGE